MTETDPGGKGSQTSPVSLEVRDDVWPTLHGWEHLCRHDASPSTLPKLWSVSGEKHLGVKLSARPLQEFKSQRETSQGMSLVSLGLWLPLELVILFRNIHQALNSMLGPILCAVPAPEVSCCIKIKWKISLSYDSCGNRGQWATSPACWVG